MILRFIYCILFNAKTAKMQMPPGNYRENSQHSYSRGIGVKIKKTHILSLLAVVALAACTPAPTAIPTMPISPTFPSTPTETNIPPSATPTPTFTPTLTSTPEPTKRPASQIFPDAEIVYSPAALDFDVETYLAQAGGFLSEYRQYLMITGWTSAAEIIQRVAIENSINPRLLLVLLEYQSGCVLGQPAAPENFDTAMGAADYYRKDLYGQLVWAAHALSAGYYGRSEGSLSEISFSDDRIVPLPADINPGSAAVMNFFAQLVDVENHAKAMAGFSALYSELFGDPWEYATLIGDLLPEGLEQPAFTLPFESGETWAYTGGPHPAFEQNGPRASLDFAPRMAVSGCEPSDEWVVAVADGWVVRSELGVVIQDLDDDGHEQTGWNVMYLHIGTEGRISDGTYVQAGEFIGHPSCEGGRATGTHLHIARKYNGVWIPAGGTIPFVLDGWTAHNGEDSYLGTLTRGDEVVTAHQFGSAISRITRDE